MGGMGSMTAKAYRVSFEGDGNSSKLNRSDGCITLNILKEH